LFKVVSDKHARHKSKYTADRMITAHTAGAIAAGSFALPALGFALGPIFKSTPHNWETVGTTSSFPNDNYVPVVMTITPGIGEAGKTTVYMRKRNPAIDVDKADQYNQFIAISTRCAHLGCPVRWVDAAERFICPCHGGVYDLLGRRVGGPPVRPLDRFYTRVEGEQVQVGPRYSVNSELDRFSPRDPGEPIDGIGQYLYPSRPSARKL
jgi:menaquinol-cytochrome c reductase iron-sulfur subunit